VNERHLTFLASPQWAEMLADDLLPWLARTVDLGDDLLEVGPGPGLTTDLLRRRVDVLTAVESDPALATALSARLAGTNATVLCADAAATDLPAGRFSAVACFSMLHHVPSVEHQDRVFAEIGRILRPGGVFVGADSRDLPVIRESHQGDVYNPVDPDRLAERFAAAGLVNTTIERDDYQFRFVAAKA
jgi:SAM-dependent methyltransferase